MMAVAGLKKDSAIRIAGEDVGSVEEITLEKTRAKLKLRLSPGVNLRQKILAAGLPEVLAARLLLGR